MKGGGLTYRREIAAAVRALNTVDRLRERALEVLRCYPRPPGIGAEEFDTLMVDVDPLHAVISWAEADGGDDGYGGCYPTALSLRSVEVPVRLLFCPAVELERWRLELWAERNRRQERDNAAADGRRSEYERAQYEALKAKFEGAP